MTAKTVDRLFSDTERVVTPETLAEAIRTVSERERQRGPHTDWPEKSEEGALWWATLLLDALPDHTEDPVLVRVHHGDSESRIRAYNAGHADAVAAAQKERDRLREGAAEYRAILTSLRARCEEQLVAHGRYGYCWNARDARLAFDIAELEARAALGDSA